MPLSGLLNPGTLSYLLGALAFAALTILLATTWRGRLRGGLLVAACAMTTTWSLGAALAYAGSSNTVSSVVLSLETLRNLFWWLFVLDLLYNRPDPAGHDIQAQQRRSQLQRLRAVLIGASVGLIAMVLVQRFHLLGVNLVAPIYAGYLLSAITGLLLVEQLFRNIDKTNRWAFKYLFIALGGLFSFDLLLYSDALLFRITDAQVWSARGLILVAITPLLAVSAARNPSWKLDVFVSRRIVFHGATIIGAGLYLIVLAAAGWWLRARGGDWGSTLYAAFLFVGVLGLVTVIASGRVRSEIRVFLSKHFFNYKYDYREQWLRFTQTLAYDEKAEITERSIRAIAELIDTNIGVLWLTQTQSENPASMRYQPIAAWNVNVARSQQIPGDASLIVFLEERGWVIDLREYNEQPSRYVGLTLPENCLDDARFIVPLFHHQQLLGFVALGEPRAELDFNWEDSDLLKIAGRQVASYLAQWQADRALNEARQFEGFTRMSTFVVHDLKNLVGQLSLLVRNAEKHKHKPEFVDDMVNTVSNSVEKMNRLLKQLKTGRFPGTQSVHVLARLAQEAVTGKKDGMPVPTLDQADTGLLVSAERDRLISVISHLLQNAQDATARSGAIRVRVFADGDQAVTEIADDGDGMDAEFLRERYFRPFDTTKGNVGMGIGAYEARHFARSSGGDLLVESEPGLGTTVQLRLPLVENQGEIATK